MKAFSEFCRCITKLFQLLVKFEYIPKLFKVGIIIPIPKGDEDRTRQGNYCGISLMTGFAKLFEKWLLSKLEPWPRDNNISKMQGAAQPKCSCMHYYAGSLAC